METFDQTICYRKEKAKFLIENSFFDNIFQLKTKYCPLCEWAMNTERWLVLAAGGLARKGPVQG